MVSTTVYYILAKDNTDPCFNHYIVIFRPLKYTKLSIISSFHSEADENCALLGCYTDSVGNSLLHLGFLTLEDGIDRLSRNTGKELPLVTI